MLPPTAKLARWAARYGPALLPLAQRLYDHGRFRQLAILHARTIDGGTFSWEMVGGDRIWVVWADDELVATYPTLDGSTDGLFPTARADRRQDPDDVTVRRIMRAARARLPRPGRPDDDWDRTPSDTDED
jgi:hypothetical protein